MQRLAIRWVDRNKTRLSFFGLKFPDWPSRMGQKNGDVKTEFSEYQVVTYMIHVQSWRPKLAGAAAH